MGDSAEEPNFLGQRVIASPVNPIENSDCHVPTSVGARQAEEREIGVARCRVVAPLHLIALKLHAMKFRPGDAAEKDWQDVVGLIRSCGIHPASAELLSIPQRYANADTVLRFNRHYYHET